jgi:hypothetical protein
LGMRCMCTLRVDRISSPSLTLILPPSQASQRDCNDITAPTSWPQMPVLLPSPRLLPRGDWSMTSLSLYPTLLHVFCTQWHPKYCLNEQKKKNP